MRCSRRWAATDDRPMFRKSLYEWRCVIHTTGFFECGPGEDGKKRKYRFNLPGGDKALYLAGLWNDFAGEARCVILTTAANPSMAGIHDRVPMVLDRGAVEQWVSDRDMALNKLRENPPELVHVAV